MSILSWLFAAAAVAAPAGPSVVQTAILAGGCMSCLAEDFSRLPGVVGVTTGYAGGALANPTLREVDAGTTGHLMAVRIDYLPAETSYSVLLDHYWRWIDPTDAGGQFCERGPQHRAAIFPLDDAQQAAALASRAGIEGRLQRPLAVEVRSAATFWPAEPEQQEFARRNPQRYDFYRRACRVDERLRRIWGPTPG